MPPCSLTLRTRISSLAWKMRGSDRTTWTCSSCLISPARMRRSRGSERQLVAGATNAILSGTWTSATGASWATPTSWINNTLPNGPGTKAFFTNAIATPQVVTLDENTTVGSIQFNNAQAYTIAQGTGGGALILDNAGVAAGITDTLGDNTVMAPITLTNFGLTTNVASATRTLTLSGAISGSGGITATGSGTLVLSGSNSYTGLNTFTGRTVSISSDSNLGAVPASPTTNLTLGNSVLLFASVSTTVSANRLISLGSAELRRCRRRDAHSCRKHQRNGRVYKGWIQQHRCAFREQQLHRRDIRHQRHSSDRQRRCRRNGRRRIYKHSRCLSFQSQ